MNLTDFKEAEAVMKILDHSDLDVPYCVPAVTMAESVCLYICGITARTLPVGVCYYKVKVYETEHSIVPHCSESKLPKVTFGPTHSPKSKQKF